MSSHRSDFTRNERRILDAATRVLVTAPAAGMAEIADAAGLGRATVYRHFATREALLAGLRVQALDATAAAIERCIAPLHGGGGDGAAGDGAGGDGAAAATEMPGAALRRLIGELVHVGDRYRLLLTSREDEAQRAEERERFEQPLRDLVERAQASGELDPALPADWVLVALGGLLGRVLAEIADGRLDADEAQRIVVHGLFEGFRPRD